MSKKHIANGTNLAEALSLPVKEGRFHIDGTFYKRPNAYPCAFFDLRGHIEVTSEYFLETISSISADRVNFKRPISKIAGYQVGKNWQNWPELEKAQRTKKAIKAKGAKALAGLSREEILELIDELKREDN